MENMIKQTYSPPVNNKVIGYTDGMAILELPDKPGELYFQKMQREYITVGEHLVDADPQPISVLPPELRRRVIAFMSGGM